jgi:hypothetical protein
VTAGATGGGSAGAVFVTGGAVVAATADGAGAGGGACGSAALERYATIANASAIPSAAATITIKSTGDFGFGGTTVGTSDRSSGNGGNATFTGGGGGGSRFACPVSAIARAAAKAASISLAATVGAFPVATAVAAASAFARAAANWPPESIITVAAGGVGCGGPKCGTLWLRAYGEAIARVDVRPGLAPSGEGVVRGSMTSVDVSGVALSAAAPDLCGGAGVGIRTVPR